LGLFPRRLPFDVRVPNATTVRAMRAADQGKGKRLNSAGALFNDLGVQKSETCSFVPVPHSWSPLFPKSPGNWGSPSYPDQVKARAKDRPLQLISRLRPTQRAGAAGIAYAETAAIA
jgi:hypothetical protein